ncbi:EamA family transporter [Oceanihabitans sediminis]|uniref:EamA/RhaT family transporter n=1 Tax=Oceanihabitans sediminis TaxID=1812012 RepID=A0A368P4G7_9FLAO|nr:EamA family transporter [Oceanihabitans sediminis]MDX1277761.1 EamA family transporter [Oceanihabitans sediminis]MDX1774809.1 EamA family transporter [Oceanihabitans sediminis]RBP32690.1 EamA-like transporter family protein [Oceanihabitans sediminis]RCU57767.1 EamA/RhaT family transporter [Oceanihabitans sediminis]
MIYLLLSILASTCIFIIFKQLGKYKINTIQAIVANYFTACLTGILAYSETINVTKIVSEDWFWGAIFLGFLFITIFNVMALTAQRNGLSVTAVAGKMSVVIPILFGLYAYQESLGWQKGIGIILALVAVYLTSVKTQTNKVNLKSLWLPIILFLGSGTIDTTIKYVESSYVSQNDVPVFSATIFCFAGIIGVGTLIVQAIKGTFKFDYRSIFGGILLGVVNYYSIYMLLKALQYEGVESSTIFTVNNVAIVMLSTIIGLIVFKEKLEKKNWIGILLAIISIVLVTLA